LKKVLESELDPVNRTGLTYKTYILTALNEMDLVDAVWDPDCTWVPDQNPKLKQISDNLSEYIVKVFEDWVKSTFVYTIPEQVVVTVITNINPAAGLTLSTILLAKKFGETYKTYREFEEKFGEYLHTFVGGRSLLSYLYYRKTGLYITQIILPSGMSEEEILDKFNYLWETYGDHLRSDGSGLDPEFKDEVLKGLKNVLINALAEKQFEFRDREIIVPKSPVELRVSDSSGNVTGLLNGQLKEEIPQSFCDEETGMVIIFFPTDSFLYNVIGAEDGEYGLEIRSLREGKKQAFAASNIPIKDDAIHQYTINWDLISQGESGATVKIDFEGDGSFELTLSAGSSFTSTVPATVDLDPDTLNLKSEEKWITCYIELPEGCNVELISPATVTIWHEGASITSVAPDSPSEVGDYDSDATSDLMVKFSRKDIIDYLKTLDPIPASVTLRIKGDIGGFTLEGEDTIKIILPVKATAFTSDVKKTALYQNYPNPFNPETTIEYDINKDCHVTLKIYNMAGQLIKVLVDEYQTAGHYAIIWHGDNEKGEEVASGVYFYQLQAGGKVLMKKMVVLK